MRSLFLAAAFTVGGALIADAQALRAPTAPSALFVAAPPGAMVTVDGCVTRESGSPQDATGAREPAAAMRFVLTQRTPPTPVVPDGSPSTRATPIGEQKFGRKMYVLVAQDGDAADFADYLNHMVRVTGVSAAPMITPPLAGRSPDTPRVAGAHAPVGATGTINVPRLAVTTLAMVSSTCR